MARHSGGLLLLAWRLLFLLGVSLGRLLIDQKPEILERWRRRVGRKLAGGALDRGALEHGWGLFLDDLARSLEGRDGAAELQAIDGSAHGAQRLRLGFDASELVRETGMLHAVVLEIAAEHGCACDADEQLLIARCFYAALATAVGEHGRRRDAAVEHETVAELGRLAGDCGGSDVGAAFGRLHAWAASRTTVAAGHDHFSLAAVLADAVAEVRAAAAARAVTVLVDLATPIEVEGVRDLLRRGLVRLLADAVTATRPGGSVTARAQILLGGRARIDIQDQCGGAGHGGNDWSIVRGTVAANGGSVHARQLAGVGCVVTIDLPGSGDAEPCCEASATGK